MKFGFGKTNRERAGSPHKNLRLEHLEARLAMAVVWGNEFATDDADPEFDQVFGEQEHAARAIVNRAIDDWNRAVVDLNYDRDNDPETNASADLELTILARDLEQEDDPAPRGTRSDAVVTEVVHGGDGQTGWMRGLPTAARIRIDDDAGRSNPFTRESLGGWFVDSTPWDDAEFTSIAGPFSSSFVDVLAIPEDRLTDLYYTVVHEIGHALGMSESHDELAILDLMTPLVDEGGDPISDLGIPGETQLQLFQGPQVSATFLGPHLYEGSAIYVAEGVAVAREDPTTVYREGSPTPIDFQTHPNQLMNHKRTTPAGGLDPVKETARLLISDLTVQILADAYGYQVALPSEIDNAHVTLDSITWTLLIQGSPRSASGAGADDVFRLSKDGDDLLVEVNQLVERVPLAQVKNILIHGNGGADVVENDDPDVTQPVRMIDFVVTTNDDAIENSTSLGGSSTSNGVVDVNKVVPGNQTTLRAAMIDAGNIDGQGAIYLPRGQYYLFLQGGGQGGGDLDVERDGDVVVIGAGAGLSVIDASFMGGGHRVLEVDGTGSVENPVQGSLALSRLTITGGNVANVGSGIGGGILNRGNLRLDQVAVIDNHARNGAGGNGGGIYNRGGRLEVTDSVFAHNGANLGAAIRTRGNEQIGFADTTIQGTVMAFHSGPLPDVYTSGALANTRSLGDNLVDVGYQGPFGSPVGNPFSEEFRVTLDCDTYGIRVSDRVYNFESPGDEPQALVVTSLADTFTGGDYEPWGLSLREAIALAQDPQQPEGLEIWAPAWDFRLYRPGPTRPAGYEDDHDIAFGDLEINYNLKIQFAGNEDASVTQSRPEYRGLDTDSTFDLWGDFGAEDATDGVVDGADFLQFQRTNGSTTNLRADANDDGIVETIDRFLYWDEYFGNELEIVWHGPPQFIT